MPFINVKILEGVSVEKKNELVKEITNTFMKVTGVSQDKVFIFFEDLKRENYGKNGSLIDFNK